MSELTEERKAEIRRVFSGFEDAFTYCWAGQQLQAEYDLLAGEVERLRAGLLEIELSPCVGISGQPEHGPYYTAAGHLVAVYTARNLLAAETGKRRYSMSEPVDSKCEMPKCPFPWHGRRRAQGRLWHFCREHIGQWDRLECKHEKERDLFLAGEGG